MLFTIIRSREKKVFRTFDDLDDGSKRQIRMSTKDAVVSLLDNLKGAGNKFFSGMPKDYKPDVQNELDQVKSITFV